LNWLSKKADLSKTRLDTVQPQSESLTAQLRQAYDNALDELWNLQLEVEEPTGEASDLSPERSWNSRSRPRLGMKVPCVTKLNNSIDYRNARNAGRSNKTSAVRLPSQTGPSGGSRGTQSHPHSVGRVGASRATSASQCRGSTASQQGLDSGSSAKCFDRHPAPLFTPKRSWRI
jgi:hypothetical protein